MFEVLANNVKHLSLSEAEEIILPIAWEDMEGGNKRGEEARGPGDGRELGTTCVTSHWTLPPSPHIFQLQSNVQTSLHANKIGPRVETSDRVDFGLQGIVG